MAMSDKQCAEVYKKAWEAAINAGNAQPETPIVVQEVDIVTGKKKENGKSWYAPSICGFALVNIKPANCNFAKWLIKSGLARKSEVDGGVNYFIREYGQSYEKKTAFAYEFANQLQKAGIKKVWVSSRLD